MKSIFLLTLLAVSLMAESPQAVVHDNQGLDMQLETEIVFAELVKVYDYNGHLVKEFPLTDVVNNKITLEDHFILEQSDFAFNYLGDYYYLSEDNLPAAVN